MTHATGITTAVSSVTLNRFEKEESMFMLKVTAKETLFLIGCDQGDSSEDEKQFEPVFQLSACVLLMFQSTENLDSSGKTIFHASFDKCWASLVSGFSTLTLKKCKPILAPFAYELRSVKSTANFGEITSQDFALDSDTVEFCIDRYSLSYAVNVVREFADKCYSLGDMVRSNSPETRIQGYKGRERLVATTIGFQLQPSSLTFLGGSDPNDLRPLLNIKCEANGKVDGSLKALNGELKVQATIFCFSKNVNDWVHLMERLQLSVKLRYEPGSLVSHMEYLLVYMYPRFPAHWVLFKHNRL